ncbi:MAG: hypothetical protein L0K43_09570, partial [Bifidobacterium crudilactis]|nr:hypothetical protein [Bifidobacterium crudilactis]
MSTQHWKGPTIPGAGDPILEAWQTYTDTAGVIIPTSSVAAARVALAQAIAAGAQVTTTRPAYFGIGAGDKRVLYSADGTKTSDSVYVMTAVNEVETDDQTYAQAWSNTVGQDVFSGMMSTGLPIRPYDRRAIVDASIFGYAKSGNVDMCVQGHGRMKLARLTAGDPQSVSATMQCVIPAGVTPGIAVGVRGGSGGGGSVALSADARFNTLSVTA